MLCVLFRLEQAHNVTYLPGSQLSGDAKGRLQKLYGFLCLLMPIFSAFGVGAACANLSSHPNSDGARDALHDVSGAVSYNTLSR